MEHWEDASRALLVLNIVLPTQRTAHACVRSTVRYDTSQKHRTRRVKARMRHWPCDPTEPRMILWYETSTAVLENDI
jgi:hypothetical protein